jgi:CubicO group peptidase (beta-lactamase class C family)
MGTRVSRLAGARNLRIFFSGVALWLAAPLPKPLRPGSRHRRNERSIDVGVPLGLEFAPEMTSRCRPVWLTILVSVLSAPLFAEAPASIPDVESVNDFLQNTVTSYKIPGLAAAIATDEGVVFAKGYGEASPGVDVTPDTPFLLGSTTKTFTALAVMRLVEQGRVELDSPVKKYLPEFQLTVKGAEDNITVRHLLNHTSGLSGKGMPGSTLGEASLQKELLSLRHCAPDSPPGKRYAYFNGNYRLLGLIVERVSGVKYGEFLTAEILGPLSMNNTRAGPEGVEALAAGHGQLFGFPFRRKQIYRPGALPSGYIVSSVSDLARFLVAEIKAGSGKPAPLDSETVKATWSPPESGKGGYAMGWQAIDEPVNGRFLVHGGALENYRSFLFINPELNLGFALLMNQGGLLPSLLGFDTARDGLVKIIHGEEVESGPGRWPIGVVTGIFFSVVGIGIWRTIRLRNWDCRVDQQEPWRRWLGPSLELLGSCFLLFGFIPLMNQLMGDKADWSMIYGLLPELFCLLVFLIALGLFRFLLKVWVLERRRRRSRSRSLASGG